MKKIVPLIAAFLFIANALPCLALDLCGDADEEVCMCGPCVCCTPVIVTEKKAEVFVPISVASEYFIEEQTAIYSDFTTDILRPPCF